MAAGLPKVTAHDSLYLSLSVVRHPFDSLHTQEVPPRALTLEAFEWADVHPLRGYKKANSAEAAQPPAQVQHGGGKYSRPRPA